jgi:alpha-L-fucosidase
MEGHLRQLLTGYGDVAVVWFDGLFDHDRYQPERFRRLVRELQPRTLTNDRLGPGDYITPEQFTPSGIPVRRPAGEPAPQLTRAAFESFVEIVTSGRSAQELEAIFGAVRAGAFPTALHPSAAEVEPWETCMTMNGAWGFVPTDPSWKSADTLVRTLIETASRGGNFLLNVGPRGDGTFPPEAIERLQAVGDWMDVNGESIWGTTHGPIQNRPGLRSTATRPYDPAADGGDVAAHSSVYLHLFDWPGASIAVPDLASGAASLLGGGELAFTRASDAVRIRLPERPPAAGVNVIAVRTAARKAATIEGSG